MRISIAIAAMVIAASPAVAERGVPFYGPKQGAFGEGYKHSVVKDGSWRIVTEYHSRDPLLALDVALYRAAELAHEAGQPYVQILGGYGSATSGVASGFVFARPSESPAAPPACRDKRCYTADVATVMEALSGPTGDQPGVAKPSSVDKFGRPVTVVGFGIGAVSWTER